MSVAQETGVVTGAELLVAALEAHGVEIVFGIPGQHALSLWEALAGSPIRTVVVRHEQAAAFAAVGYARTTGRVGVCITSTGPGAFNAFAGMGEADASSHRVLHITTQVPSDAGERGWMHETSGQSAAFTAVTRHHVRPATPRALSAAVDEALCAIASRPGPAMIEAMTTVLTAPAEREQVRVTPLSPPAPDPAAVARVRELLDGAQAPIVFAGGGCRLAAEQVRELAELLDAPVVTSFNGKGVLPPGHPLHAGSSCEEPSVQGLIASSDVCLALGTRFAEEYTCHWAVAFPERLVQVDLDPGRIGRNYPVREGIVSDVGLFCQVLIAAGVTGGARDGTAAARAAVAGRQSEVAAHGFEAERELMHQLDVALPDDAIVIADMTIQAYWAVLYLDARRPGGFCYPMSGALGSGIPTALGTTAAHPESATVVLIGDGGFLMGGHELATAQRNGLHFVTLLVNDSGYGVLKNYQMAAYGRTTAVDLGSPDFEQLAAGYGVNYRRISGTGEVGAALREAVAGLDAGCWLIELATDLQAPPQSL
ncbi:MAG: 5-guanidino-2-oxopentanoate decarboxylase [Gaiellales bacterium]|nr:5-guanidino-2-oxopentanoate decarboxylase [Gaiellales bacterium]